ncbi:glutathione peroxidase [Ruicaihuangia caeni]|uniref:Glutathione peroxidase n=1 Tax=Ruicaihuangia caeni TaxID=3042517 RepID=A0AAW6T819_9MICO|nr:glutathione peroxidase [Klugiella sp. YN-L-19]MDI2099689.1 glutathione peroxidase [Klugiella sp. YN-L-19]
MSVVTVPFDVPIRKSDGSHITLEEHRGKVLLIVNVASECGNTPQYEGLEQLQREYGERGLQVLAFPCNQFGEQEPGTDEQIQEFCRTEFGVSFPVFSKIDVNGDNRHPLYAALTGAPDAAGTAGDVQWNFEKFLVGADGTVAARVRPKVQPIDPEFVSVLETVLGGEEPPA